MIISKLSNPPRKPGGTFLGTLAPAVAAALLTYFLSGGLTVGHTSYVRAGSNKTDGRTVGLRFSVPLVTFGKEDLLCIDRDGFRTQRGAGKTDTHPPHLLFALSYPMIAIIR